jgi:hypothetical protein
MYATVASTDARDILTGLRPGAQVHEVHWQRLAQVHSGLESSDNPGFVADAVFLRHKCAGCDPVSRGTKRNESALYDK